MDNIQFKIRVIFFTLLIFLGSGPVANAQEPISATSDAQLLPDLPRRAV